MVPTRGTVAFLARAKEEGFILTHGDISSLIYKVQGDLRKLPKKTQQELKYIGHTVYELNCSQDFHSNLRSFEWTAKMVETIVDFFPNLKKLNFDGSLIRELDGFFGALLPLNKLKALSMNDVTLVDRHIEQLAKRTGITTLTSCFSVVGIEKKISAVFPRLVEYDSRLSELIAPDAKIEKLADDFEWVEGPIWNKKEGCLLFSDIPRNSIFKWKEGENVSLFLHPSGYSGKRVFQGKEPGSNTAFAKSLE